MVPLQSNGTHRNDCTETEGLWVPTSVYVITCPVNSKVCNCV